MRKPDAAGEPIDRRSDPRDAAPPRLALTSTWSIRSKLVAVLAVPVAALIALWAVVTWVTLGPGLALLDARDSVDRTGRPLQTVITSLQAERKLAVGFLATGEDAGPPDQQLAIQHEQTDAAVDDFRASADTGDARSALTPVGARRLDDLLLHLSTLPDLRASVRRGTIDGSEALRRYTQVVEAGLTLVRALVRPSTEDLLREAQALVALSEARELLAREDTVIAGAVRAGQFAATDLSQAVQLIGARRHQAELALADLHATDRAAYTDLVASEPAATLHALEDRLIAQARAGEPVPVDTQAWGNAYDRVAEDLRTFELEAADRLVERSRPDALFIFGRIAVTGLIGLLAVVVTAFGSLRVARSVLRRLAGLHQAALELAIDRIPRVVTRLRAGERVDVAAEAPPLPYGDDEIGQVGHAFNVLQRQAVGAAVAEADLRRGVNEVFLNIARRSQALLHRQLSILDNMERRAEDPVELEDLFRVDHLATRMRRHAEDLVILAGAAPGRGWRQPVPLVDVVRGAISEIEDYARVTVQPVPDVAVTGRTVGDLIHLFAELIENATAFSPPSTKVTIGAEPVTHGLAVEIEDRGIGIPPATLDRLNAHLADPPDFGELASRSSGPSGELASRSSGPSGELASRSSGPSGEPASPSSGPSGEPASPSSGPSSEPATEGLRSEPASQSGGTDERGAEPAAGAQLGLFVVARLAARHGITVQLRRSAYGGTTAVALLPDSLLARPGERPALPGGSEPTTGSLLPLSSASPTAPRSAAVGFTPAPAQGGGPLPSRRPRAAEPDQPPPGEVIVATTGRPLGRHSQREVIDPADDLPRRVRRRDQADDSVPAPQASPEVGETGQNTSGPKGATATRPDDARSPEQVRAMMSSFQEGLARGREAAGAGEPDRTHAAAVVDDAARAGGDRPDPAADPERDARLDGGEQSGSQAPAAGSGGRASRRRRAGGGADGEATEAT